MLLAHSGKYIRWVQSNYNMPVGVLTESSIELNNKHIKMARKRFSRKMSFAKENQDILRLRLWCSDPLLYYESFVLQKLRPGNIKPRKNKF